MPFQAPRSSPRKYEPNSPEPGPSLPPAKTTQTLEAENDEDDENIGPAPPHADRTKRKANGEADENEEGGDDDSGDSAFEDERDEEADRTPISHEVVLKDHTKVGFNLEPLADSF